jgi:3-phosphoshikimate 1-carboxyvinyltransferase
MKRIIEPLTMMGANISSILRNGCAPLYIAPGNLHGIHYDSPVSSAQVKSCILLAGLYAEGETSVTEPSLSRNHTELMLKEFGADIRTLHSLSGTEATAYIKPYPKLYGQKIVVPGDISSAAYFIAAGLIVPDSEILIEHVGINPTRSGILKVCEDMGGDITLLNERCEAGEKIADILVRTSSLHGITIEGDIIPTLIDEIPIIAVMAAVADGTTVIKDAAELKVKETDRIETVTDNLKAMGCNVTPTEDGMIITGGTLHGASTHTLLDHRIAMAFSIAALVADGTTKILDSKCVDVSYPTFYDTFEQLL